MRRRTRLIVSIVSVAISATIAVLIALSYVAGYQGVRVADGNVTIIHSARGRIGILTVYGVAKPGAKFWRWGRCDATPIPPIWCLPRAFAGGRPKPPALACGFEFHRDFETLRVKPVKVDPDGFEDFPDRILIVPAWPAVVITAWPFGCSRLGSL